MKEISELTGPIAKLIAELEANPMISIQVMLDLLADASLTINDIDPFSYFNHPEGESYGRLSVYQSKRLKVLVLSWNPGDFTAIHDHEPAEWGAVQFFGDISHRLYSLENNQVVLQQAATIQHGQMVGVTGKLIHAMGNLSSQPAFTLHIYGTNTEFNTEFNTRVFDLELGKVVMTEGPAFLTRNPASCNVTSDGVTAKGETWNDYVQNTTVWRSKQ